MTDVDEDRLLLAFRGRSLPPSLHVSYDTHGFLVFQLLRVFLCLTQVINELIEKQEIIGCTTGEGDKR